MASILLADCDQMFVTVARLVDPAGAGKAPLLVVGGAAGSRGVVCSASYEARAFGVRSGMSIARAAKLCPTATFVPVPGKECRSKSRAVRAALDRWTPVVEAASIDEFYLDLTGTEALYRQASLTEIAGRIREAVLESTGMRLSIGGGSNRLVAKLAAERAKPRGETGGTGVLVVEPGQEARFLATHRLAEIPGVGPSLQAKLARRGLVTVPDALPLDERSLSAWLGDRTGQWLYRRIRGQAGSAVVPRNEAKSMSREATFPRDLDSDRDLETELLRLTTRVAADLRGAGLGARVVTVKLRHFDFVTRSRSKTLASPVDDDPSIFEVAKELLGGLRRRQRRPARLLGVALSRLEARPGSSQLSLWETGVPQRSRQISHLVDQINNRYGGSAVRPARLSKPAAKVPGPPRRQPGGSTPF
ncbi:MAG: DNA polymerase IV [Gemmatimonadetes bacterium]|nr:DNA polymerase IV [Gemmatimonadota bacterium]